MKKVGFIGWRGMVGSVLIKRMIDESDFNDFESYFFSTSQVGQKNPEWNIDFKNKILIDAFDIQELSQMHIIMTCQGGEYTNKVFFKLRASGWSGHWVDVASTLRMETDSMIVLDPINQPSIDKAYADLGLKLSTHTKDAIKSYLANKPKGVFGKHKYKSAGLGDGVAQQERNAFKRYQQYFGVPNDN